MAIRFPHQMPEADEPLMSSINTTPLVDVMLVLLIIFLITIPVVNSSIAVNLPRDSTHESQALPQNIILTVAAHGAAFYVDQPAATNDVLVAQRAPAAQGDPPPD